MGFLDRIGTVIRANINDLIDRAEDPEKMVRQLLEDMENDLIEVKKAVALAIATEKKLFNSHEEHAKKAEGWQQKAELAVSKGEDELAKEALQRRKTEQSTADGFESQYTIQKANVSTLREQLTALEGKISEARIKKDLLIARSRQAEAQENMQRTMGKVDSSGAMSAFERMERKVEEKEATATALTDITGDSLDAKFRKLETTEDVDNELAALKSRMGK
ncbi:MAG: PspA/IM30 family protein [Candidatus Sericytochromatia bacterium]|nr:PspA/IM30 family protein [Candidatus Sericytochromatia bacterium]